MVMDSERGVGGGNSSSSLWCEEQDSTGGLCRLFQDHSVEDIELTLSTVFVENSTFAIEVRLEMRNLTKFKV